MRGVGPQPEMGQDFLTHVRLVEKGDDAHGSATAWTQQGIGLMMRGTVACVCPKPDQYTFCSGMGVRFTTITTEARERVLALVNSLKRGGQPT